jgi:DNA-binding response OmpR family regulator
LRLAIIDNDLDFVREVGGRATRADIETFHLGPKELRPRSLKAMKIDAILVDRIALGTFFWTWLEAVCGELPQTGVLVCTKKADLAARVRGLRQGADDWITKPAAPSEIIARIEVSRRGRRQKSPIQEEALTVGELEIRPIAFDAWVSGRQIGLTPREFELIHFLARETGRVLEREAIYQRVWGYAMVSGDRSVDTYIRKLRIKLVAASPHWAYIHTHFGIGYRFEAKRAHEAGTHRLEGPERLARETPVDEPDHEDIAVSLASLS